MEAEFYYQQVLRWKPRHFNAMHLLGVVAFSKGQMERGVELISKAIQIFPRFADAHYNLGNGLSELKRFVEALASYDTAIRQALARRGTDRIWQGAA